MSLSPLEYLGHILDETEYLMDESHDLQKEHFIKDATLKACLRSKHRNHRRSIKESAH